MQPGTVFWGMLNGTSALQYINLNIIRERRFLCGLFVFIFGLPVKPSGCVRVFSDQMGLSACQYVHVPGDLTVELNFP